MDNRETARKFLDKASNIDRWESSNKYVYEVPINGWSRFDRNLLEAIKNWTGAADVKVKGEGILELYFDSDDNG